MQEVKLVAEEPSYEFALCGEIDSKNAEEFYGAVTARFDAAPRDVVFDCADLSFIDSTTLGTFVKLLKRIKEKGRGMKLVNVQPRIKKLFVICALDTIMEIA